MTFDPKIPFNELPLLPPKAELETKVVLKKCISANRAVAELKGTGDLIPNQSMLINAIPLQEARLSSEIENIVTTTDKLFRAAIESDDKSDPQTKEVVRYRTALRYGFDALAKRPLSTNLFCEMCGLIVDKEITVRKIPGTHLKNPDTGEVVYTPPDGEGIIRDKLANLEKFIHSANDLDPLIKAAVIHYQFEAIHPFHDGNGRTGRIITLLYLISQGLLKIPVLYLSRYIIEHKNEYYSLLRKVTERGDWEPWLIYMLSGIEETAGWTTGRIRMIRDLFDKTCERARQELPKGTYSKELIEAIFVQPYCKIKYIMDSSKLHRQTASKYLQELENVGVLKAVIHGKEKIYVNPKLLKVLTA